ncbi:MAG TPA: hypothetical protein VMT46_01250 [Anaerolineaceae bacterium]|nr:hypothetical protein [Anaerolineaceae bacterium]
MKVVSCDDLGGNDPILSGTVGDGTSDIRKMNIAYDFGVDPHGMAWTMWWEQQNFNRNYHYWIYPDADRGTLTFLVTLRFYHEPILVAVKHGSHWVLVTGYDADIDSPYSPSQLHHIKYYDPLDGQPYTQTYSDWKNSWFTIYTDSRDPDPSVGPYVPPPDHWVNHFVTIERDGYQLNPDWGISTNGPIPRYPVYLPVVQK